MKNNNIDDETEKKAREILEKISDKLDMLGKPICKTRLQEGEDDRISIHDKSGRVIVCRACTKDIKRGDICITMPCCGFLFHLECIGKIATAHHLMMNHACPRCMEEFDLEFEKKIRKMYEKYRKTFDK